MERPNEIRPKQYTHIDYEGLLIYAMKNRRSIEESLKELDIDIARSTVGRNLKKLKNKSKGTNQVIEFYRDLYVPNMQTMPEWLKAMIEKLPDKDVIIKDKFEDLHQILLQMKQVVDESGGNISEAARRINEGSTSLGNIKNITPQGLRKDMLRLQQIEKAIAKKDEIETERE